MINKHAAEERAIREEERRRISRELHDSTSQLLVILQLKVGELARSSDPATSLIAEEMVQVISDIRESVRELGLRSNDSGEDADSAKVAMAKIFYSIGKLDQSIR